MTAKAPWFDRKSGGFDACYVENFMSIFGHMLLDHSKFDH